jgi:hypothetical protein
MPIWEFVILLAVLIWIGIKLNTPWREAPKMGRKYTVIPVGEYNFGGYDEPYVEKRLNEIGRWNRRLVLIWMPPNGDPKRDLYAIFEEPIPFGESK